MDEKRGNGLESAFRQTADGAFAISPEGRITLWNPAAERILGYPSGEAIGRFCCDVFRGRDIHGNRMCHPGCPIMALVGLGEPIENVDMRTETKEGKPIWVNVTTLVLPAERHENSVTVHLFRDVTSNRELVQRLAHEPAPAARPAPERHTEDMATLTPRELDVLRLLAQAAGTRDMARKLHVSPATVRNHVQNLLRKLGVHSRLEAVTHAARNHLI